MRRVTSLASVEEKEELIASRLYGGVGREDRGHRRTVSQLPLEQSSA
jgi:hypothetical protein